MEPVPEGAPAQGFACNELEGSIDSFAVLGSGKFKGSVQGRAIA